MLGRRLDRTSSAGHSAVVPSSASRARQQQLRTQQISPLPRHEMGTARLDRLDRRHTRYREAKIAFAGSEAPDVPRGFVLPSRRSGARERAPFASCAAGLLAVKGRNNRMREEGEKEILNKRYFRIRGWRDGSERRGAPVGAGASGARGRM